MDGVRGVIVIVVSSHLQHHHLHVNTAHHITHTLALSIPGYLARHAHTLAIVSWPASTFTRIGLSIHTFTRNAAEASPDLFASSAACSRPRESFKLILILNAYPTLSSTAHNRFRYLNPSYSDTTLRPVYSLMRNLILIGSDCAKKSHIHVYIICPTTAPHGSWLTVVGSPGLSSRALLPKGRGRGARAYRRRHHTFVPRLCQTGGGMCILSCIGTSLARLSPLVVAHLVSLDLIVSRLFPLIVGSGSLDLGVIDGLYEQ